MPNILKIISCIYVYMYIHVVAFVLIMSLAHQLCSSCSQSMCCFDWMYGCSAEARAHKLNRLYPTACLYQVLYCIFARQGPPLFNAIPPRVHKNALLDATLSFLGLQFAHDLAYYVDELRIPLGIQP